MEAFPMMRRNLAHATAVLVGAVLAACGGGGLSPSAPEGVTLRGTVQGVTARAEVGASSLRAAADTVTVTVQENPAITATVGADGTFVLRGLPAGSFTLAFTRNGTSLGTLTFAAVQPNHEITITVDVSGGTVVLFDERRNGIGHGDLEIEGLVQDVVALNPSGDSRFLIQGYSVIARPGATAIREGNRARNVEDVTEGRRVHVKAEWVALAPGATTQDVLAHEIKLQGDEVDDGPTTRACMINGGRVGAGIELEGRVMSGGASSFRLQVNGGRADGPVDVQGGEVKCSPASGPNAPTPAQCRARVTSGAKVHVSGTLRTCDASSAQVDANEVRVQGN
jgi:hypothetical protein